MSDLFVGFRADRFPRTSLPAFVLAADAYAVDLDTGEAVSLAVRDALFEEGRDVADPAVLADVAAAHGVPAASDRSAADRHDDQHDHRIADAAPPPQEPPGRSRRGVAHGRSGSTG